MTQYSILNHNIYYKPIGFNTTANEYKRERGKIYPNLVKDFDILMLQECFNAMNPGFENFLHDINNIGFQYIAIGEQPGFTDQTLSDSGLLIASKLPIIYSEFCPSNFGVQTDALVHKGILYAQIQGENGVIIHCFNFHLQAFYNRLGFDERLATHEVQIFEIIQYKKFIKNSLSRFYKNGDFAFMSADSNFDFLGKEDDKYIEKILNILDYDKTFKKSADNLGRFAEQLLEYNNDLFSLNNVYFDHHGKFDITHCDTIEYQGEKIPVEQVITDPDEWYSELSLDQVWEIKMKNKKSKIKIVPKSSKVERFRVKNQPFLFISDHYGISFKISYQQINYSSQFFVLNSKFHLFCF